MHCGAIFEINPVIVESTAFKDNDILNKKTNIKAKKRKNNEILVKVEFNLEEGNIRKIKNIKNISHFSKDKN